MWRRGPGAGVATGVSGSTVGVENAGDPGTGRRHGATAATRRSFLGAHLLLGCTGGAFVSMTDPPAGLEAAARDCRQHRCWPVLAGPAGEDDVALVSPIILEDHPTLAAQSPGSLFDSTEIDEILTLRILTMTEEEKAEARATDPRAAQILDRSEQLSAQDMARLHGLMYDPLGATGPARADRPGGRGTTGDEADVPWWDPERGRGRRPRDRRGDGGRHPRQPGQPGGAAPEPPGRRPGPVPGRADRRASPACTPTSTVRPTSGWCSWTTRRPTCTSGTAATCTSARTSWSRSAPPQPGRTREGDRDMRLIGIATTALVCVAAAAAVVVAVRSVPDIKRYPRCGACEPAEHGDARCLAGRGRHR